MRALRVVTIAMTVMGLASVAVAQRGGQRSAEERAAAERAEVEKMMAMPRPIDAVDSVWLEELTWLEVRDAMRAGKTTIIVPTGGMEQNGTYLATGKHNYVNRAMCEAIARKLGNALCAPNVVFVPEGSIDPPSGHMHYPGSISTGEATFQALLTDIANSLRVTGFEHIILLGDSGGNQRGMKEVASTLGVHREDVRLEAGVRRESRRRVDHGDPPDRRSGLREDEAAHREGADEDERDRAHARDEGN